MRSRPTLAVLAVALALGCEGAEATAARIASIEPFDPQHSEYPQFTSTAGEPFVQHPVFGCVRADDLVRITYDLTPAADGQPRRGYVYGNANGTSYTLRSLLRGLVVGSTMPAAFSVHHSVFAFNGPRVVIEIPTLDDRVVESQPPLERRACVGMRGAEDR